MRRALVMITLAAAIAVLSGTAEARDQWKTAPPAKARAVAARYAACLINTERAQVEAALALPVGDADTGKRFAGIMTSPCMAPAQGGLPTGPSAMSVNSLIARGLLVEALYHRDFDKAPETTSFADVPVIAYPVGSLDGPTPTARDYRALMRIGDCMVRAAPDAARALIATKPASEQEAAAMSALAPAQNGCMAPTAPRGFSPEINRMMIAEPLYRLSRARIGKGGK